jgi:glycolate oxidase
MLKRVRIQMLNEMLSELKQVFGDRFSTEQAVLYSYASDASIYRKKPDGVVRPANTEEVSKLVKMANKHKVALVPRGAGTGLCGGAVAMEGGIVVDLQLMNKIKEIKPENMYCVMEPGVIYDKLNAELAKRGYQFPGSPGSAEAANIGGMVAANASGMRAVKYGATRDYVIGLEVVLPSGEIMRCGTKTVKNSSGYQLEKLFVGSEGTLGIITEITLRIVTLPKSRMVALVIFEEVERAGQAISSIMAHPVIPSSMEIMDNTTITAVNKGADAGLPDVGAILIIECDGPEEEVAREMATVERLCKEGGATSFEKTADPKVFGKWHAARKSVLPALGRYRPDLKVVNLADDMAVPISRLAEAIIAFKEIADRNGVIIATYGHASDGNLHTKMLLDPTKKDDWQRAEQAVKEVYDAVLELDGTVTGEHGVGISKAPYMKKERASALSTMRAIKRALDPNNIMNPGKIFDWESEHIITHLRYPAEVD